ncbi:TetR family transcriptional regulator [Gordonia shandongensis]|uniref:TetR/AcrR family transcriptional regulator n=1 Tax=Gordonia shandongensis TaxID=376351 RepID=UPI0004174629|nr:TetR family transcriptional regulator [Gordonia shandongensis]
MKQQPEPRRGRRGGDSTARADILAAGRALFGEHGFSRTTIRAVAAEAGVDVALIPYYFGSKRGLFTAVMEVPTDPVAHVADAARGPRDRLGERLVSAFLGLWETDSSGPALRAMLRSTAGDEGTATAFGDFTSHEMLPHIGRITGLSAPTVRVLTSCLFGLATMRYVVRAPAFVDLDVEQLVADYGSRVQAIIDADDRASTP